MKPFLDKIASLTPISRRNVFEKATEPPHTGIYTPLIAIIRLFVLSHQQTNRLE